MTAADSHPASEARARPLRIGLTGPIGCGKSTIAAWLADAGGIVIDADEIARDVTEPGEPGLAAVRDRFGPGILRQDGSLDRAVLAARVFEDAAELAALEAIVHPAVRTRLLAALAAADAAAARFVVIEAIKLVEGGLAALCDEVWLVRCSPATQRVRLAGRGAGGTDAERRIKAQGDIAARLRPAATRVIETDGSPEATRRTILAALSEALHDTRTRRSGR
ncbi:MAG TPA: dephospho-CoA kinase [Candidatus Limnocylindrales bacterium]|nr:dephospho-CoA kinase [Candidatus Limnocylindrales bacterium]